MQFLTLTLHQSLLPINCCRDTFRRLVLLNSYRVRFSGTTFSYPLRFGGSLTHGGRWEALLGLVTVHPSEASCWRYVEDKFVSSATSGRGMLAVWLLGLWCSLRRGEAREDDDNTDSDALYIVTVGRSLSVEH